MKYGWLSLVPLRTRQWMMFAGDVLIICLSLATAVLLRFDFRATATSWELYYWGALFIILICRLPLAVLFGLYRWSFRFASVRDLLNIFYTVALSSLICVGILYAADRNFSRGILIMEGVISFLLMGGMRFGGRVSQAYLSATRSSARPALLMGDPGQVDIWVRTLARTGEVPFLLRGAVCHRSSLVGRQIQNIPVIDLERVPEFVELYGIKDILVISDSVSGPDLRRLIELTGKYGIRFRRILTTRLNLLEEGKTQRLFDEIRPEDLLRRTRVQTNLKVVLHQLTGKRIWVTGAAGSIGSELVRQLLHLQPASLTLVDFNENGLYLITRELEQMQRKSDRLKSTLLRERFIDLKHSSRVEAALREDCPEYIFHAAAHKHVGMMESHPHNAVENNVLALKNLLGSAAAARVKRFVNISTDKASDPVSVMGATKRLGELLCALGDHDVLETVSVRFGNVLGSQGSVIPLFLQQIDRGGPVTITDKRATRFFMTISEAVELILQASVIGKSRGIYLLNMGSSVNLHELARELISLRGFIPEVEIPIVEIGLRKGERLHEQLHNKQETLVSTDCESVLELECVLPEKERFARELDDFLGRNGARTSDQLKADLVSWLADMEAAPEAVLS
jgi:FlaA1/EpsC-like NDP-sugar epimerase